MLAASPSMVLRSIFRRGFAADASSADNETDCIVIGLLLYELSAGSDLRVPEPFLPWKDGRACTVAPRRERVGQGRCGFLAGRGAGRGGSLIRPWRPAPDAALP